MVLWKRTDDAPMGIDFELAVTGYCTISSSLLAAHYAPDELRRLRKEMLERAKLEIERDLKRNAEFYVPEEWKVKSP